jgi:hypothetical protein
MYLYNILQWLDVIQFGLLARHSTTPQYMKCRGHVMLSFNTNISTVAVFSDIDKPLKLQGTMGLLYDLLKLNFSGNSVKLSSSFLLKIKFRTSVTNITFTPNEIHTGVPKGFVLSRTFYNLYINNAPNTRMTSAYTPALDAKKVIFSHRYNATLHKLGRGVSPGILILVYMIFRLSISLVDMDGRSHILH